MASISALEVHGGSKVYTFKPVGSPALGVVDYFNDTGVPDADLGGKLPVIGRPRIRLTTVRGSATKNARVIVQIDTPVLADSASSTPGVAPAAVRAYNPIAKIEYFIPRQSGPVSNERLYDLIRGIANNTVIKQAVVDQEFPW